MSPRSLIPKARVAAAPGTSSEANAEFLHHGAVRDRSDQVFGKFIKLRVHTYSFRADSMVFIALGLIEEPARERQFLQESEFFGKPAIQT